MHICQTNFQKGVDFYMDLWYNKVYLKGGSYIMYEKDKSTRITLRLNEEQRDYVLASSLMLGISPSDFLRMVINTMSCQVSNEECKKVILSKGGIRRENEDTIQYNQL